MFDHFKRSTSLKHFVFCFSYLYYVLFEHLRAWFSCAILYQCRVQKIDRSSAKSEVMYLLITFHIFKVRGELLTKNDSLRKKLS